MAATPTPITICSAFRTSIGGTVATDPVDVTDAGGTLRLTASATFDAVAGAHAAAVEIDIQTAETDAGPWWTIMTRVLDKDSASDRFVVPGVDNLVRARLRFGGIGGVAVTIEGTAI